MVNLDHIILKINDLSASVDFSVNVMGFHLEGQREPFTVIRVNADFVLQLAPGGTSGDEHLAFSQPRQDFDTVFARLKARGLEFGDSFHSVGNNAGPGVEVGARGQAPTVYVYDPNKHLLEIRTYAEPAQG